MYADFEEQYRDARTELIRRGDSGLASLLETRSGWMLFNDPRVSLKPGRLYLVGFNPGDQHVDPEGPRDESLEWWVTQEARLKHSYSSYLDEAAAAGGHQQRVRDLLDRYGDGATREDRIRSTFATNLYFFGTRKAEELAEYPPELINCWEYHKTFLEIVQPEMIVCSGNGWRSAYSEVKRAVMADGRTIQDLADRSVSSTGRVKAFVCTPGWSAETRGTLVLGVPHLSRPFAPMEKLFAAMDEMVAEAQAEECSR